MHSNVVYQINFRIYMNRPTSHHLHVIQLLVVEEVKQKFPMF